MNLDEKDGSRPYGEDETGGATHLVFESTLGERLDHFLVKQLPDFSRARIQTLIKEGYVRVNGAAAEKNGQAIEVGSRIEISIPPVKAVAALMAEKMDLKIIYEDDDLMVLNKPAGMVVHPSAGHDSGTLVNAALAHAPDMEGISGEIRPGVVHRLDKDTSGILVMAKNDKAQHWLQEQFRLRSVTKVYIALVDGHPPTPTGRIEAPIGRDSVHRQRMAVTSPEKGRESITEYKTLKKFALHTLLEAHPLTGRTHQIRVHLAFLGCPVAGDLIYGHRKSSLALDRHFLHAARLSITLPGRKQPSLFEAPLPDELEAILNSLELPKG